MNSSYSSDEMRARARERARVPARARALFELIQLETIMKPLQFPYQSITK